MKRLLVLLIFCLILPMSYAETVIDHVPYVIDSPGTYVLNSDLNGGSLGSAIIINSNNVVLDGQGHKITNAYITANGGPYNKFENVTIKNIKIFNSTVSGISLKYCKNAKLEHIVANNNSNSGILLMLCSNCQISYVTANNNKHGISLTDSNHIKLSNINVEKNNKYGIYLFCSNYNTFDGLKTSKNGKYGVCLSGSYNNTFYNWQIPEGWDNCGNINDSGYNGNIFYNSSSGNSTEGNESSSEVSSGNTIKTPIPLPAIIIILSIPIIALRKLN